MTWNYVNGRPHSFKNLCKLKLSVARSWSEWKEFQHETVKWQLAYVYAVEFSYSVHSIEVQHCQCHEDLTSESVTKHVRLGNRDENPTALQFMGAVNSHIAHIGRDWGFWLLLIANFTNQKETRFVFQYTCLAWDVVIQTACICKKQAV